MTKQLTIHHPRGRLRLAMTLPLIAGLLAQAILGWPANAPRTIHAQQSAAAVAPLATLTLQPASGLVGTLVSVSATGFPRQADLSNGATLSFDTTPIPGEQAPIVGCTGTTFISFGFGPACNANSPALTYTIPPNAAPGIHTFVATASSDAGTFTSSPASFTVLAPASPTGTPTATATVFTPSPTATVNTPTATATATSTVAATSTPSVVASTSTATATGTATQTLVPPTATFTPVPPSPTPTATATARPQAIVLIKPAFSAGVVAVIVHTGANAHVGIDFQVLAPDAQGHQQQQYDLKKDGTTSSLGAFAIRMAIAYHKPGTAVITVTLGSGNATRTVRRSYRYGVTGG